MEGDVVTMQEIYTFQQTGIAADGTVLGRFRATGIRPHFLERVRAYGIALSDGMFDPARIYE